MKSSTLLAGVLALLIACGVSFGAGYYLAKSQTAESPTPKTQVSDTGDINPSLDGAPLEAPEKKPGTSEQANPEPDTPTVTPKPRVDLEPVVDGDKPVSDRPRTNPGVDPVAPPKDDAEKLKNEIESLKEKLKALPVEPENFEDIFNGPQIDFTATVSGQVVDQAGTAVAGASVHASYSENFSSGEGNRVSFVMARGEGKGEVIATTDASGSFSATISRKIGEKSSLQVSLTAAADGYAESEKSTFTLKNGDDKQGVKLALRGAGSVAGRVVDGNGRGVSGVKVGLNNSSSGNFYSDTLELDFGGGGGGSKYSAMTDGAGEFLIEGVAEARYKFRLTGTGYRQISGPTEIDVKTGQAIRAPADFQVEVTASVSVKFTTATGGAIVGWVTLAFKDDSGKVVKRLQGQLNSESMFEKNDPPVGTFDVEITVMGYKPHMARAIIVEGQRYDFGVLAVEMAPEGAGTGILLPDGD